MSLPASVPARYLGTVYLLHFDRPYRHARHYLGWARNLDARLAEHGTGQGARLLQVARAAGISWTLARTWPGVTRNRERQLKRMGGAARRCPLCGIDPRPDRRTALSAGWVVAYRLRELTDQWWECTNPTERARIDAEIDALTAVPMRTSAPGITDLIKPRPMAA
jgi:predicted GIY-YIG superfamily endonuclease